MSDEIPGHRIALMRVTKFRSTYLWEATCSCGDYRSPPSTAGAARKWGTAHAKSKRKVPAGDLVPYLAAKPKSPVAVQLGGLLFNVTGIQYDHEQELHALQLDPGCEKVAARLVKRATRPDR